jgi:hypothetical protein
MLAQLSDYVNMPAPTEGGFEDYTNCAVKEVRSRSVEIRS